MSILRKTAPAEPPSLPAAQDAAPPAAARDTSSNGLLSPEEAGALLGVPATLLQRWRTTGDGPQFVRLTRKTIKYRAEDVQAFIESRRVSSTAA